MKFSVLSSGSKANCTLIEAGETRVLVDCGLSAKQTEARLAAIGVEPTTLKAIVITHEHSDHIAGLDVFARRHKLPVYLTEGTREAYDVYLASATRDRAAPAKAFERCLIPRGSTFSIAGIEVLPFSVSHDAAEPVGFRFSREGLVYVQCTDLGRVTTGVKEALRGAHAMCLESNHDEELLRSCEYPWNVKERILSNQGHLSNHTAGNLLFEIMHSDLNHVVLGHLSEHSNRPDVALSTVETYLPQKRSFQLECASVHHPLPLRSVESTARESSSIPRAA